VINPPVSTSDYTGRKSEGYWLSVNRLVMHKRIELQTEAFKSLPDEKLIIVGSYEEGVTQFESYKSYIEKIKPSNVTIVHWVDDQKLKDLYAGCKGFITTAKDEDFGMTVLEAMAAGKPVIAPQEGGYKETVTSSTGVLIDSIDSTKVLVAIKNILENLQNNPDKYKEACLARSSEFDTSVFISKIKQELQKIL